MNGHADPHGPTMYKSRRFEDVQTKIYIEVYTEDGYSKDLSTCKRQSQASKRTARSGRVHSGISDNFGLPRQCRDKSSARKITATVSSVKIAETS